VELYFASVRIWGRVRPSPLGTSATSGPTAPAQDDVDR
jgi:hypothetical protein